MMWQAHSNFEILVSSRIYLENSYQNDLTSKSKYHLRCNKSFDSYAD